VDLSEANWLVSDDALAATPNDQRLTRVRMALVAVTDKPEFGSAGSVTVDGNKCLNKLDLPLNDSKQVMRTKLMLALTSDPAMGTA
jgi:hypothetical protein